MESVHIWITAEPLKPYTRPSGVPERDLAAQVDRADVDAHAFLDEGGEAP